MAKGVVVPITPAVLRWAVKDAGITPDGVAEKIKVKPSVFSSWLSGDSRPNLGQFNKLVDFFRRPSAIFFLPSEPATSFPNISFRHSPKSLRSDLNIEERRSIRETARVQRSLIWISKELGINSVNLPQHLTNTNPEAAAESINKYLKIKEGFYEKWGNEFDALKGWRSLLEEAGVFVFFLPLGEEGCRGFSLWDERAPIICVNTHWNAQARIFTMFHELAHLISRTSSACADAALLGAKSDPIERWCETFASAILLPWAQMERELEAIEYKKPIEDLEVVRRIARKFKVSIRATAIRLITKGLATWDLYEQIPVLIDGKKGGGTATEKRTLAVVKRDQYGRKTGRLIESAVRKDILSPKSALSIVDAPYSYFDYFKG